MHDKSILKLLDLGLGMFNHKLKFLENLFKHESNEIFNKVANISAINKKKTTGIAYLGATIFYYLEIFLYLFFLFFYSNEPLP